jgi:hypothetical protein
VQTEWLLQDTSHNCVLLLTDLPGGQVAHMDVVNSGLEALENEALGSSQIESLRLMSNRIQHVGERAFR